MSLEKRGTPALGVLNAGHKARRRRDSAISAAVVGAMIAVAFCLGCSSAEQEGGLVPSSTAADASADVRDCIRVRRIEIVDDAGRVVGVVQSVGRGEDSSAYLELLAHGDRGDGKGRVVHIDPQMVFISGDGGSTWFWATCAEWASTSPPGEDDVMVRIDANSDGGFVHVK